MQNFANHRRIDPWYHLVAFPLILLAFAWACLHAARRQGGGLWEVFLAFGLLVLLFRVRIYSLRVQDRVIRLEETLRMKALLPEAWQGRIQELKPGQFVALRFASDEELPELVQTALEEHLDGEAIKRRIRVWRPDTFRV